MAIQTQYIEYREGDTVLEGYLAFDDTRRDPGPTVLIAHAWEGRDEFVCAKARELAELGYSAFALDVYGKDVLGSTREEKTALMTPLLEDRALLRRRLLAGLEAACSCDAVDSAQVAVIGYCFGGLCALDLARTGAELRGAASFHGLLSAPGDTGGNRIRAKILILHGDKDPLVPVEQVVECQRELTAAGADWQLHTFGSAQHSFTDPKAADAESGLVYDPDADRRSQRQLLLFLEEIFA